jgi:hypothetical protein
MKYRYLVFIVLLLFPAASSAISIRLVIPGPSAPFKVRNPFIENLLMMIFTKQGINLELAYASENISQGRALKELNNSDIIDLTWSVTTTERERSLTPVRIPLYQGFIGWRVFIINKINQEKFNKVNTLKDLSELLAVQRFDWPDYQIFIDNGLSVDGSLAFSQMYKAIENDLADYFPRAVLEATRELASLNSKQLVIEQTLLLKYPSSYYFFVAKNNHELADIIKKGFEKSLADGSYQLLFQQYFGSALEALNIKERKVFHLRNSLLPEQKIPL